MMVVRGKYTNMLVLLLLLFLRCSKVFCCSRLTQKFEILKLQRPYDKGEEDKIVHSSDSRRREDQFRIKQLMYEHQNTLKIKGGSRITEVENPVTSEIPSTIVNLVNNVAGAGLLCLPAGMAAGTGFFPAIIICTILGLMSGHTFSMIGYVSHCTGETDFKGLCSKTIGKHSAWMTDAAIAVMNFAGGIIYAGILGDVFTPLLEVAGISSRLNHRWSNIVIISAAVLTPLSLLEQLSFMKYTSFLGCISVFYTIIFMVVRSLDGSYAANSVYFNTLAENMKPSFERESLWKCNLSSLVLIANLSLAYIAHFNAPRYYAELKNRTPKRFNVAVYLAFLILIAIHAGAMLAGYKTFGDNSQSNITLNYHPNDILAVLARIATGFSILFGYPLEFIGMRDGYLGACRSFLEMTQENEKTPKNSWVISILKWSTDSKNLKTLSIGLLAVMTVIAAIVEDIGLTVGVSGALIGAMIVYVVPVLIYYLAKMKYEPASITIGSKLCLFYIPFGVIVAVMGTVVSIKEYISK